MGFSFGVDPDQASNGNFEPIPKGDYEVFISNVELKTFSTGNQGLNVTYTIRDDISGQKYGRRKVFDVFVALETMKWKFNNLAVALGYPKGTNFTLEEFAKAIQSKPLIISVDHRRDDEGNIRETVRAYKMSQVGGEMAMPASQDPFMNDGKPIEISDDDLPF